jgi:hypothetical protein
MSQNKEQAHVVYKCDYHIVWTLKYRFRILEGQNKEQVEREIRSLTELKGFKIEEKTRLEYLKGQRFVQQQRTEGLKNDGGYAPKFIINPPALQVVV